MPIYHSDDERLNSLRIVLIGSKENTIITDIEEGLNESEIKKDTTIVKMDK